MNSSFRSLYLLDPSVIFLNHGSFGACPIPVFETYQNWQRELERQPVEFLGRRINGLLAESREILGRFLNISGDDLVFFPNPTTAINMVVRSLKLEPGDEVLASNHEYGAMDRTWRFICKLSGAQYINHKIPLPVHDPEAFIAQFISGISPKTKVIFLSHITSPTALIFPIEEIVKIARQSGILTIIDGAHAPGQITLNLKSIGADIYTGALHKWLGAPKGSAFLYVRKDLQDIFEPLVVSWGYESETHGKSRFIDYHEWQGTRDLAAFLSVPAAIAFQEQHGWHSIRADCHNLATQARRRINYITGLESICPEGNIWFSQMCAIRVPKLGNNHYQPRLYENYRIEIPVIQWQGDTFLRLSVQGYNQETDIDLLVRAVGELLDASHVH